MKTAVILSAALLACLCVMSEARFAGKYYSTKATEMAERVPSEGRFLHLLLLTDSINNGRS